MLVLTRRNSEISTRTTAYMGIGRSFDVSSRGWKCRDHAGEEEGGDNAVSSPNGVHGGAPGTNAFPAIPAISCYDYMYYCCKQSQAKWH